MHVAIFGFRFRYTSVPSTNEVFALTRYRSSAQQLCSRRAGCPVRGVYSSRSPENQLRTWYNLPVVLGWLNRRNCKLLWKQAETRDGELAGPAPHGEADESRWHRRDANISKCLNGTISKSKSDYTEAFANVGRPRGWGGDLNFLTNIACNAASFIHTATLFAASPIRTEINNAVNVRSIRR